MQAIDKTFLQFLEGVDKKFSIPVFQRNYDWRKEQCEQLFNDLLDIAKYNFRNHFFGSIVYVFDDSKPGIEFLIIDGQQRIATISLLLLALHNLLEKKEIESEIELLSEQIKELYLIDKFAKNENRIKLKLVKKDNEAYLKLFNNNTEEFISNSNITRNYLYFVDRIAGINILADDLFEAIKKLLIVDIRLDGNDDDPQLIFESLNSTGLNLTQADLVRNFILMGKSKDLQEMLYNTFWRPIEDNTRDNRLDSFIRDFLTFKERVIPNKDKIYVSFKKYVKRNYLSSDSEPLLKELLKFSKYYKRIVLSLDDNPDINAVLKRINKLDVTVSYPFLLEIFGYREEKVLDDNDLINILKIIENYAFRRLICSVPTNALNKVFATIGRDIKKHAEYKENYCEIFKYILINKKHSQRFPNDEEFVEMLSIRDIYNLQSKNKIHLLERLENYDNVEKVNVEELLNENTLTIEHIMPRMLTASWKESLGEKWEEVHDKYLNILGNITLTGYNSKLSNRSFTEKRDMGKGFRESKLTLNKYLWNLDTWDEDTIINRTAILADIALKVWAYPITDYIGREADYNQYFLAEEYDFTGDKIRSFSFFGQEYPVKSWKEFYSALSLILYELDPIIFTSFLEDEDFIKTRRMISKNEKDLRSPFKINSNIFIESNLSSQSVVNNILIMLRKYEIDEDEVIVAIAEKEGESLSDTQKKRIKFWSELLEIDSGKTRHFINKRSHKYYDLYSSSGIKGFSYYYAIKQKSAVIGIYIDTENKEKNEHIFNKLFEKKGEIEIGFGEHLLWFNDRNARAKFIYKEYSFAGLINMEQWPILQNNMVNDMVKLTDIFDKYIKEFG